MTGEGLPDDVRKFILECISSAEQLEILALFRKVPSHEWSADAVAAELRTNTPMTEQRLDELTKKGLIAMRRTVNGTRYLFGNPEPALDAKIDRLLGYVTTHRVAVYEAVYARAETSIRTWADAFRFRR